MKTEIVSRPFGRTKSGKDVVCYTLRCGELSAEILTYGGAVRSLTVPDRNRKPTDVVLGYRTLEEYEENDGHLGGIIGRVANRIGGGRMTVDGKEYELFRNDNGNTLHGGAEGFDRKVWDASVSGGKLILRYFSPNLEENFPGNLMCEVRYSLKDNGLVLEYSASADAKTPISLTNHAYFNLGGEDSGDILSQELFIAAKTFTAIDQTLLPIGLRPVGNTPFDFRVAKPIGRDIGDDCEQLAFGHGYDHNFCLENHGKLARAAEAFSEQTGIGMEVLTDLPGVQFYSGNFLDADGKRSHYGKRCGFCLETQYYPDSVNHPEFPSPFFDDGEVFVSATVYRFFMR